MLEVVGIHIQQVAENQQRNYYTKVDLEFANDLRCFREECRLSSKRGEIKGKDDRESAYIFLEAKISRVSPVISVHNLWKKEIVLLTKKSYRFY